MSFDFEMVETNPRLPEGYEPFYESEPRSYQLSNFGMLTVQELMDSAGLLTVSRVSYVIRSLLLRTLGLADLEETGLGKITAGGRPWLHKKIYSHKFESNDGWYISPSECLLIASELKKHEPDNFSSLLKGQAANALGEIESRKVAAEWIAFNAAAAQNRGYRVY